MFAEYFEMFVIEPIFHGSLNWNSPLIPMLFMAVFFLPLSFVIVNPAILAAAALINL